MEAALVHLTDEHVHSFWEQGFLPLGRITTDQELTWLRTVSDKIIKRKLGYTSDKLSQRPMGADPEALVTIVSPERVVPELKSTVFYRNVRKIFPRLLGVAETHLLMGWRIFLKLAHAGETPWHQDAAYRPPPHYGAGVWMPLDSVTRENGCLQYISGSQRGSLRPHSRHDDNLVASDVDPSQATMCPLAHGEAVIHDCYTLHYAGPNTTDRPRRALAIVCQVAGSEI